MSKLAVIEELVTDGDGDCVVEGFDYPLIPEGDYQAVIESYDTSTRFCKQGKDSKVREGGKIYLHFHIDPYNDAGLGVDKVITFMALNAKTVAIPAGRNGKFSVGARSKYAKIFNTLFPAHAKILRRSPRNLMNKLLQVRVRTVKTNERQKQLKDHERYSVVDEILGLD